MRTYELRTYPSIAKKNVAWNSINGYLPAQGCRKLGGRGYTPPTPRFWQISKPYLNQEEQIMPTKLLSPPPSDYRTFCHPCYIQCHGQDMAISIMVTVHNNETILICSLIRLLNTALSSIIFFLSNYPFFPSLAFERKHVHRAEITWERVSLQVWNRK